MRQLALSIEPKLREGMINTKWFDKVEGMIMTMLDDICNRMERGARRDYADIQPHCTRRHVLG